MTPSHDPHPDPHRAPPEGGVRPRLWDRHPNDRYEGSFAKGVGLVFGGHIAVAFLTTVFADARVALLVVVLFSVFQLVYVIPLAARFERRGESLTRRGIVIAALVTGLLNGCCWVAAITSFGLR